jgi:hypothetical protein
MSRFLDSLDATNQWNSTLANLMQRTHTSQERLADLLRTSKSSVNQMVNGRKIPEWDYFVAILQYFVEQPAGLVTWQAVSDWAQAWNVAQGGSGNLSDIYLYMEIFPNVSRPLLLWIEKYIRRGAKLPDLVVMLRSMTPDLPISSTALRFALQLLSGCPDPSDIDVSRFERMLEEIRTIVSDNSRKLTDLRHKLGSKITLKQAGPLPGYYLKWKSQQLVTEWRQQPREMVTGLVAIVTALAALPARAYLSIDDGLIWAGMLALILWYHVPQIKNRTQGQLTK